MPLRSFSIIFFFISVLFLGHFDCSATEVAVSILPQRYFVKRIAGERVRVTVIVPPGYNPAVYEPTPFQMKKIEKVKIYFAIGVPFEKVWLNKFVSINRDLLIVHTDKDIKKREIVFKWMESKKRVTDPHIWLSPILVKKQARIIANALINIDPDGRELYKRNLNSFLLQIDKLDMEIKDILRGEQGRAFLVFHPCWGYFAERYGLRQIPIELQGREPSGLWLSRLIRYCRDKHIKVIFVQPQFSQKTARIIAHEIGAKLIIIDPLAEDWEQNLRHVAEEIKRAISSS